MKKEKRQADVEERRARKYIAAVIIYTLVMLAIVAVGFLMPGKDKGAKDSLPQKSDVSLNFSSTYIM